MSELKKGSKLVCIPCGREVVVSSIGVSQKTIWCCDKPMQLGKKKVKEAVKTVKKKVCKRSPCKKK